MTQAYAAAEPSAAALCFAANERLWAWIPEVKGGQTTKAVPLEILLACALSWAIFSSLGSRQTYGIFICDVLH